MASGMPVNDICVTTFNELKLRHAFKWIIFKIDHDEIVVEKKGTSGKDDFSKELPTSDCRYAVYDEGKYIYPCIFRLLSTTAAGATTHVAAARGPRGGCCCSCVHVAWPVDHYEFRYLAL